MFFPAYFDMLILIFSYYPFYPPNEEMCLDYEKFHSPCIMPCTPHVLLIPSEFKQFVKVSESITFYPAHLKHANHVCSI